MVKQFVSPVRVYKYPFELIAVAYQTRFPYNARVPIMMKSELLEEKKSEDGTKETKVRRCTLKIDAPYLMRKISGIESAIFRTTTELDWVARRFIITSVNETFSSRGKVIETCIFSEHCENSDWTCYEQDCSIEMISVWGFEQQAEKLAIDRYIARLPKTKEVMELFVEDVWKAGLHVPEPYVGPQAAAAAVVPDTAPSTPSKSVASGGTKSANSSGGGGGGSSHHRRSGSSGSHHRRTASGHGLGDIATEAQATSAETTTVSSVGSTTAAVSIATRSPSVSDVLATAAAGPCVASVSSSEDRALYALRRRDSAGIDSDKLEEEYIQRFLGELTPYQESNLIQLKQKLSTLLKDKIPNDAVLLRFLRARDFNIEKAIDMVTRHVTWRKQYQVDRLVDTWEPSDIFGQYYAGGWHNFDKRGHPVYLMRLGQVDIKGLLKAVGETDLLKQVVAHEEDGLRRCERATRSSDKAISTVTLICDLEGLSLRHLWRPGLRAADRIIQILLNNYPETMGRLLFVRAPRIFPVLWAIVSQFLDEATREKFVFLAGNDYQNKTGGLADYIEPENVPDFLGGPCKCMVPSGGLVPKELQIRGDDEFLDTEAADCALDTAYQTATVTKDRPCEVILPVDCDSVLFWDFDISRGKVYFSVLRVNSIGDSDRPPAENSASTSTSTAASTSAASKASTAPSTAAPPAVSAVSVGHSVSTLNTLNTHSFSETGSYDSRQELSEALHVVGPTLYHDNDSVQGTYTVNRSGIYLLRWELCPPTSTTASILSSSTGNGGGGAAVAAGGMAPGSHAVSVTTNTPMAAAGGAAATGPSSSLLSERFWKKANLMYYLEVLQPDRFKGSVSSLESWQSAVSTLSKDSALTDGDADSLAVHIPPLTAALQQQQPVRLGSSPGSAAAASAALGPSGTFISHTRSPSATASLSSANSNSAGQQNVKPSSTPVVRKRQLWTDV
eukprot:scpid25638/ scgid18410/ SEC14-like protein 1